MRRTTPNHPWTLFGSHPETRRRWRRRHGPPAEASHSNLGVETLDLPPVLSDKQSSIRRGVLSGGLILRVLLLLAFLLPLLAIFADRPHVTSAARRVHPRIVGPNLLIIVADDHTGLALGVAGDNHEATPNLDTLARQGVYFERAYCNSPVCTPSRQSLITGLLPHQVGVTQLRTKLPPTARTLGHILGEQGYRTAAIGKMHFNDALHHGFDLRIDVGKWMQHLKLHPPKDGDRRREFKPFIDPPAIWMNADCKETGLPDASMTTHYFVDQAIDFVQTDRAQRFALVLSLYDPHAPFRFPREWEGRYRPEQFPVPLMSEQERKDQPLAFRDLTEAQIQGVQAAYYTSLAYMDDQIGRLLRKLEESGLDRDTIVVYVGDNGYMLGQHGRFEKHCFYEPSVRVPFMIRWPGNLPAGRRVAEPVELVDLMPTILNLVKVPPPDVLSGIDLLPLIEQRSDARARAMVLSEYPENEEAMVRSARYKFIVGSGGRRRMDHMQSGLPLPGPYTRLYDLQQDPDEDHDLANDPQYSVLKTQMFEEMYRRLVSTRAGLAPIPRGLSDLETILWCLVPRDK